MDNSNIKRFLCFDLGIKSLGVAISDSLGISYPKEQFNFEKNNYFLARKRVIELVFENNIDSIVIGLPLQIDRNEGERCESVRKFATDLKNENPNLKIYLYDESYSTIEARERLKDCGYKEEKIKSVIDMYSAVVILEDFINNYKNNTK